MNYYRTILANGGEVLGVVPEGFIPPKRTPTRMNENQARSLLDIVFDTLQAHPWITSVEIERLTHLSKFQVRNCLQRLAGRKQVKVSDVSTETAEKGKKLYLYATKGTAWKQ